MMNRLLRTVVLLAAAAAVAHGQQLATLSVTVLDPSGRVIDGARVIVSSVNTGIDRAQRTNHWASRCSTLSRRAVTGSP